ncbi:ChaB family protein [Geodermatophilus sp. URMC 65]
MFKCARSQPSRGTRMDSYDDERRANQVAWAAVKHTHEKVGDHWEPKDHKGPATRRPRADGTPTARPRAASTPTPPRNT